MVVFLVLLIVEVLEQTHYTPLVSNCSVKSLKHFLCTYMKYHNSPCCVTHVKMPSTLCFGEVTSIFFQTVCQKKGIIDLKKVKVKIHFKIKLHNPNCWMPKLHKYRVMNIVFIYLFLGLIIGVKNLRDMCHLVYGQFDLEPLQFRVG